MTSIPIPGRDLRPSRDKRNPGIPRYNTKVWVEIYTANYRNYGNLEIVNK